jgi:outer membrane receptor protein involved in Fe transport
MGAWTPAKKTTRYNGSAGVRVVAGKLIVDGSFRRGLTQNLANGNIRQVQTSWRELGLVQPNGSQGVADPATSTLNGQTMGLTLRYAPTSWWTHELVLGVDEEHVEVKGTAPGFITAADTLLSYSKINEARMSQLYTTTARVPMGRMATATVTFGADHWRNTSSSSTGSATSISGALSQATVTRDPPGKNTGGFLQTQLALWDALFLTYGLRAEWNPNYGDEAQPNYAPRYGAALTREFGPLTAKLRTSYGRSTRPPAQKIKLAQPQANPTTLTLYGPFDFQIASPDLGPEFQQGIEAGFELYYRNRASLIVTRYNQTVDRLISRISPVDSIKSLAINPQVADSHDSQGFGYFYIAQNLNVGSIRNQGWELQGSVYFGPFGTKGTYSWTKSRVIGITPQYRNLLGSNTAFQVGRPFDYLPEHTWGVTETFSNRIATVAFTLNGHGQYYKGRDYLFANATTTWRDPYYRLRQDIPSFYRSLGSNHTTADFNAAYRVTSIFEGIAQVQNLTNYYQEDIDVTLPAIGRQSKVGVRIKF